MGIHAIIEDKTQLGERFVTCSCGNTARGGTYDNAAMLNHEYHIEQVAKERTEELKAASAPADPAVVYTGASATVQLKIADGDGRFDFLVPPGIPNIPSHFTDPRNYGPGDFYVRPNGITIQYGHDGSGPAWTVDGVTFDGFWAKDGFALWPLPHVRTPGPMTVSRSAALDAPGVNDAVRALAVAHMPTADPFAR